jgi:hypothetical protein
VTTHSDEELASLRTEISELREQVNKPPRPPAGKDIWDKLSTFSTLFSSLVLGAVGIIATTVYNNRQLSLQQLQSDRDRDLKIVETESRAKIDQAQALDKLMHYVASDDPREREFGYGTSAHGVRRRLQAAANDTQGIRASYGDIPWLGLRDCQPVYQTLMQLAFPRLVEHVPTS